MTNLNIKDYSAKQILKKFNLILDFKEMSDLTLSKRTLDFTNYVRSIECPTYCGVLPA